MGSQFPQFSDLERQIKHYQDFNAAKTILLGYYPELRQRGLVNLDLYENIADLTNSIALDFYLSRLFDANDRTSSKKSVPFLLDDDLRPVNNEAESEKLLGSQLGTPSHRVFSQGNQFFINSRKIPRQKKLYSVP